MPDAPPPSLFFSSTITSAPDPCPVSSSASARRYAVERPWTPPPRTMYGADSGRFGLIEVLPYGQRCFKIAPEPTTMPRTGQPAVRRVAAAERALAVLNALSDGSAELVRTEIARSTGTNAAQVSRVLATRAGAGIAEPVPGTGRYRLGVRLLQLGNAVLARLDLREIARPHLQDLVNETGETATLSAPGDRDAVTVDFVLSPSTVQSVARVGRPSIAHATATGKVMLAFGTVDVPGPLKTY